MQKEITTPGPLLAPNGDLLARGWARKFLLTYEKGHVKGRLKEWDYYAVLHPEYGVTFTFTDLGVMGLLSVVWLDFKEKTFHSEDEVKLFTRGRMGHPESSETGDLSFAGKKVTMRFERRAGERELAVSFPDYWDGKGIECHLTLEQDPAMDSIVVATPFKKKHQFYYNHKVNCMPAEGTVTLDGKEYPFTRDECMGVLDWGRGVWPYRNRWYWGSASGRVDGVPIGWNIGYGFGDLSTHTENIVFYDGHGHKLNQVEFHFDPEDYLAPWRFTSDDGRFEMDFEPILDRNGKVNLLVFKSVQHQVFGYYTGHVVLDDGTKVHVDKLLGFAEDVYNRW